MINGNDNAKTKRTKMKKKYKDSAHLTSIIFILLVNVSGQLNNIWVSLSSF